MKKLRKRSFAKKASWVFLIMVFISIIAFSYIYEVVIFATPYKLITYFCIGMYVVLNIIDAVMEAMKYVKNGKKEE